jgi:hypothetical protein
MQYFFQNRFQHDSFAKLCGFCRISSPAAIKYKPPAPQSQQIRPVRVFKKRRKVVQAVNLPADSKHQLL